MTKSTKESKSLPLPKPSKRGCAITRHQTFYNIAKIMVFLIIFVVILNTIMIIAFDEKQTHFPSFFAVFPSLALVIILQSNERKYIITKSIVKNKKLKRQTKGESNNMLELAKQLIGEECKIISIGIGPVKGIIKEVTDGAVKVETKYGDYVFNADFIMAIEKKNKKQK